LTPKAWWGSLKCKWGIVDNSGYKRPLLCRSQLAPLFLRTGVTLLPASRLRLHLGTKILRNQAFGASDSFLKTKVLACRKNTIKNMLLGEFSHNLDSKGRVAIPAKFKAKLTAGAIITRGIDNCLFVFANEEWEILAQKLIALPMAQANSRAFVRLMLAGAMDVNLDNQSRILVPDYLRKYADFKKRVVIAGLYNRVEIWDADRWESYKKKTEAAYRKSRALG